VSLSLCLALVTCGLPNPPVTVTEDLRLPEGKYVAAIIVTDSVGSCDWVKSLSLFFYVDVTAAGAFSPSIPELKCTTRYAFSKVFLECTGLLRLSAQGDLPSAMGTGTADGDIGGCRHLDYEWYVVAVE